MSLWGPGTTWPVDLVKFLKGLEILLVQNLGTMVLFLSFSSAT